MNRLVSLFLFAKYRFAVGSWNEFVTGNNQMLTSLVFHLSKPNILQTIGFEVEQGGGYQCTHNWSKLHSSGKLTSENETPSNEIALKRAYHPIGTRHNSETSGLFL